MQPSDFVLKMLAKVLEMPISYFYKQRIAIGPVNFRVDPRVPAKSSTQMVSIAQDKIEHYLDIEDILAISLKSIILYGESLFIPQKMLKQQL